MMKFILKSVIAIAILIPATYGVLSFLEHEPQALEVIENIPEQAQRVLAEGEKKFREVESLSPVF
jgi:hypothetical protein